MRDRNRRTAKREARRSSRQASPPPSIVLSHHRVTHGPDFPPRSPQPSDTLSHVDPTVSLTSDAASLLTELCDSTPTVPPFQPQRLPSTPTPTLGDAIGVAADIHNAEGDSYRPMQFTFSPSHATSVYSLCEPPLVASARDSLRTMRETARVWIEDTPPPGREALEDLVDETLVLEHIIATLRSGGSSVQSVDQAMSLWSLFSDYQLTRLNLAGSAYDSFRGLLFSSVFDFLSQFWGSALSQFSVALVAPEPRSPVAEASPIPSAPADAPVGVGPSVRTNRGPTGLGRNQWVAPPEWLVDLNRVADAIGDSGLTESVQRLSHEIIRTSQESIDRPDIDRLSVTSDNINRCLQQLERTQAPEKSSDLAAIHQKIGTIREYLKRLTSKKLGLKSRSPTPAPPTLSPPGAIPPRPLDSWTPERDIKPGTPAKKSHLPTILSSASSGIIRTGNRPAPTPAPTPQPPIPAPQPSGVNLNPHPLPSPSPLAGASDRYISPRNPDAGERLPRSRVPLARPSAASTSRDAAALMEHLVDRGLDEANAADIHYWRQLVSRLIGDCTFAPLHPRQAGSPRDPGPSAANCRVGMVCVNTEHRRLALSCTEPVCVDVTIDLSELLAALEVSQAARLAELLALVFRAGDGRSDRAYHHHSPPGTAHFHRRRRSAYAGPSTSSRRKAPRGKPLKRHGNGKGKGRASPSDVEDMDGMDEELDEFYDSG